MHAIARTGYRYMPVKLKGILIRYGITQSAVAERCLQPNGAPLSKSAIAQLMNWGYWPRTTPRQTIETAVLELLRARKVSAEEIASMWDADPEDAYRQAQPVGVHAGQSQNTRRLHAVRAEDADTESVEKEMLTAAAKKHFSLFRDPFVNDVVEATDVFLSADQRYIREAMYATARHGGFLAVVGESGAGKTTLRRDLLERLRDEPVTVIQPRVIDKGRLTAGLICDAIICDMSQHQPKRSLEAKARQVEQILQGSSRSGNSHVLMIEEAHDLGIQTLKYLKRFWELEDGFKKLLAIILIGQPELKAMLDERQNYEAREVIRRCEIAELAPLNGNLEDYLALKMKRVGKSLDEVFEKSAFDAIRVRLSRPKAKSVESTMFPLVVNNLVVKAMNVCTQIGAPRVNADVVREL